MYIKYIKSRCMTRAAADRSNCGYLPEHPVDPSASATGAIVVFTTLLTWLPCLILLYVVA